MLSLALVEWLNGDRFQLSLDEGIYLDGASRVAHGQTPYRDFFTFTGPGAFWFYGAVFRIFGTTFTNARWVLSFEIALLAALIYWLAAMVTSGRFAAGLGALFVAFCLDSPGVLYISHRWDSNSWALLAAAIACSGYRNPRRAHWIASGVSIAIAAWTTPPFVAVAAAIAVWMVWSGGVERLRDFMIGVAVPSLCAVAALLSLGALGAMKDQLLWATSHYGAPNRVPYGYLVETQPSLRLIEVLTPAILPVIAYIGLAALFFRRRKRVQENQGVVELLVLFSVGVLAAGLPRLGAHQLVFLSPVFWVLSGYVVSTAAGRFARWLGPCAAALAILLLVSGIAINRGFTEVIETSAGSMRCGPEDAKFLSALGGKINPGETLFVFPYLPVMYFVMGGEDPSRFSFLQPGMMTERDETDVLAELRAHPPQWMLWARFPEKFWLGVWPHTNPARLDFPKLENFMKENYREAMRVEMTNQQSLVLGLRN